MKKEKARKLIKVDIPYTYVDFEGEINEVSKRVKDLGAYQVTYYKSIKQSPPHFDILRLERTWDEDGEPYKLVAYRYETDEEIAKEKARITKISKALKEKAEERKGLIENKEKAEYERLKKKYGF